jgi:RNA polymerase sigma-70 factor (ECF subfamily)
MLGAMSSLAQRFAALAQQPGWADDGVAHALAELCDRGRAAWPRLQLDDEALLQQIARTLPQPPPAAIADALLRLHAADLWLACACACGDAAALVAFERAYGSHMREQAERASAAAADADDAAQRVRIRLLTGASPRIGEYAGRAPLASWLAVAARRAALDDTRVHARRQARREDAELEHAIASDDPELEQLRAEYRGPFERALAKALAELEPRERNLFRQTLLQRVRIVDLAGLHGVDRRTVARWLDRARERVLQSVCASMQAELGARSTELGSALRWVASRLELGLSVALQSSAQGHETGF